MPDSATSLTWYIHQRAIPKFADVWWWENDIYLATIEVSVLSPQAKDGQVHFACAYITSAVDSTICLYVRIWDVDIGTADPFFSMHSLIYRHLHFFWLYPCVDCAMQRHLLLSSHCIVWLWHTESWRDR